MPVSAIGGGEGWAGPSFMEFTVLLDSVTFILLSFPLSYSFGPRRPLGIQFHVVLPFIRFLYVASSLCPSLFLVHSLLQ